MMRVLLTGASGAVGREVLKQLSQILEGIEITVFDKKTKDTEASYRKLNKKITLIYGDISVKDDVCDACKNKDIVIHLAAIIPPLADKKPELAEAVNIKGTRNLIECLENQSPNAFFIYSSSISVYGDRNRDPWIKTSDKLLPSDRDEYARTKIEAEKIITGSKLSWTIFRLTAIMGTDNHKPSALMFHMPLDTCLEIATPGDTGRAFVNALHHQEELKGTIFNLGGGEKCRISYRDFLAGSFKAMGLGALNFKNNTFAGRNFHCGYYADGEVLNDILDFRRDTLADYFEALEESISPARRLAVKMLSKIIKRNLAKKSEPLAAVNTDNKTDIRHYF